MSGENSPAALRSPAASPLRQKWTFNGLEEAAPVEKKYGKASKGLLKRLVKMTKEDWRYTAMAMLGSMGAGSLTVLMAVILGENLRVYYIPNAASMKRHLSTNGLYLVGLGLIAPFIMILQQYPTAIVGEKLVKRAREKMFAAILRNEPGWFDEDDNNSSHLSSRLTSDAANLKVAYIDTFAVLLQNLSLIVVSFGISLYLRWNVALVMIFVFPLVTTALMAENIFLQGFGGAKAKAYARATHTAGQGVANIRTVAAFNAEDKIQALYAQELELPAHKSFTRGMVAGCLYGISRFLQYSSQALLFWYSGLEVHRGNATFSEVARIVMIFLCGTYAAAESLAVAPALAKGRAAVTSAFDLLDRKTKMEPNDPEGLKVHQVQGDIELRDVTLAYPSRPDVFVLTSMNLKVLSGQSLALVGASGSGKSSIIRLIERFYDPLSGEILIDGVSIKMYNLQSLRKHIAMVQQEPSLFNTTIYDNILYGEESASEAEVIEAAKAANAHNFISALPDGYMTQVGERGMQLSGGQKQRVAIARAVLKDPAIFLLDEATSALDAEGERIVQDALDRLMTGRTTVMVAHRLTTIRGANSIAVLRDGKIVEEGSHSSLVSRGGEYTSLLNLQVDMQIS